jgi:hypothetical protein
LFFETARANRHGGDGSGATAAGAATAGFMVWKKGFASDRGARIDLITETVKRGPLVP